MATATTQTTWQDDAARANLRRRLPLFANYHRRAVAIARSLAAIPGVVVAPDSPQTRIMRVYLWGEPERLLAARALLFRRLAPTGVPGVFKVELSIGDAADALTDDEVAALFARVMAG